MAQSSQPLHEAIWKNDRNAFNSCLEKEEDLNKEDENGLKPLHIAVMTSNEKFVKDLLNDKTKKVEIDSKAWYYLTAIKNEKIVSHFMEYNAATSVSDLTDDNGLTPLHHAVINRNERLISLFCGLECKVNSCAKNGFTPLHFATVANDSQTIDMLLLRRADASIKTVDGYTALHLAVRNKHSESANLLIAMGSNVNDVVDSTGASALHIALENNDKSMVELLLQNDADVMCRDLDGKCLLHVAAEHGYENWIDFFIEKGIDVNSVTYDNSTSLLIALQNKKPNIAAKLLAHKANVNTKNNDGLSPLCAALQLNDTKLSKRLVTLKADVNNLTLENSSILHFAVRYCDKKMISYLLQRGAKLGVRDYLGQNELHLAARYNNSDVLEHLLKLGMNINERTLDKSTALHCAVSAGIPSYNNVEVLTKKGINIDAENAGGDTALNLICRAASRGDRYNIIEHLLIAKADPNHIGSDKHMPLYTLIEQTHIGTGLLLAKYGANCDRASSHGDSVLQLLIKLPCGCACTRMGFVQSFLELGADINSVNDDGETVIHTSLMHEKHECLSEIRNFLDSGARLTKNKLGENVLHMALKYLGTQSEIKNIFTFFLEKDVKLNRITKNGSNILHYAVQYSNNVDILKIILDKTKYRLINDKDGDGKTALHIAAASGANNLVEVLLERDVDINSKDKNDNTALHHAIIGNHIETVTLLLKKGASTTVKNKDGFNVYDLAEQKDRHIYQLLLNR